MKHEKTIEQEYRVLDEIEHVRARSARYVGSTTLKETDTYVLKTGSIVKEQVRYIPAFIKLFEEITNNAVDEYKRAPDVLTTIKISIDQLTGSITVEDNGRGIPVQKHSETNQYVPEMIFTNLRAGSNFSEDDWTGAGTNGEGATLCVILSEWFQVETADGKNAFKQEYTNGLRKKSKPLINASTRHYTKISYCPDYNHFGMTDGLDDHHYSMLSKIVVDTAATNTSINFFLNGQPVKINTFEDYVKMYQSEYVYEETGDWKIAAARNDTFEHISFVNGINTYVGGTHVDYVSAQIVSKLRDYIKKKHKVDVKPADIKNHLRLFLSCNINRPRFDSQVKSTMVSPVSEWKTTFEVSDKFIKKLINSSVIQSILDWASAKAAAQEAAEDRQKNKESEKTNIRSIPKFHDATIKNRANTMLFLAEGDSALTPLLGVKTPEMGIFPLRGRPINVSAAKKEQIKENVEFESIRTIVGLKYGVAADIKNLNFGKIVVASDADEFGKSICGLTINMFYRLWPEIVEAGMLYRLITPMIIVEGKGIDEEFFSIESFEEWRNKNQHKKFTYRFLKGLGSNNTKRFRKYIENPDKYLVQLTLDGDEDRRLLDLCFLKDKGFSDMRKQWLALED